jgi:glycosyltransferase involved in cell wall biosynthesis
MSRSSTVSVIVPAHNEERYLGRCLASLQAQEAEFPVEIIVVDNRSTDGTRDIALRSGVAVVASASATPAGVRNDGAAVAGGEFLAFLDGDCTAPGRWLATMVARLRADDGAVAIGGPCVAPSDGTWVERAWAPPVSTARDAAGLAAANLMVRRDVFDRLAGFDRTLMTAEDDDLARRLRREGRVISATDVTVVHHGYPRDLASIFAKSLWHGSSQLRAHGLFGDRMVMLTLAWLGCLGALAVALVARLPLGALLLAAAALVLLPAALAQARLRRSAPAVRLAAFLPLVLIGNFVLAGRAAGIVRELRGAGRRPR